MVLPMKRNDEIRHLKENHEKLEELVSLLNKFRKWEDLMRIIPYNLSDIGADDLLTSNAIRKKYKSEHIA